VERGAGGAEQVAAPQQIDAVVDVAAVSRAAPRGDEARRAQLREVVRHQVLWPVQHFGELTHTAIAAGQLTDELPTLRVGDQPEELLRRTIDRISAHVQKLYQSELMDLVGIAISTPWM
jgi:hypothetical protein